MSGIPKGRWRHISWDFFGSLASGDSSFVIADFHSKFKLVEVMKSTNTITVINQFKRIFSVFSHPESIKQDNGTPFNSRGFRDYLKSVNTQDFTNLTRAPTIKCSCGLIVN